MATTLFILNDAPYGNERACNALRLASAVAGKVDQQVRLFLMADAVACATRSWSKARGAAHWPSWRTGLSRPTRFCCSDGTQRP